MSTARKLGFGFGTLLLILIVTGLTVFVRLRSLEQRLREIAIAEPTNAAAYEMELNIAATSLGILKYLDTPRPEYREQVARKLSEFGAIRGRYEALSVSPRAREAASRVAGLYEQLRSVGQELMDGEDRLRELSTALAKDFETVDKGLFERIRAGIGRGSPEESQKLEAANDLWAGVGDVGSWLGHYRRTSNLTYRTRMLASLEELVADLRRFTALPLSQEERRWAAGLKAQVDRVAAGVKEGVSLEDAERQGIERFIGIRAELDQVLAQGTRAPAEQELRAAQASAERSMRVALATIIGLLVVGIVIGGATAVAVGRGIVGTERALTAERERGRVTLASIGDGVIVTDALGKVTYLNPVARELTGWSPEEAAGRPLRDVFAVVSEATGRAVPDPVARVARGEATSAPEERSLLVARDGSQRPIAESAAPIRQGGTVTGVVFVFRDDTEVRRAEKAAREALFYAEGAVDNLRMPLLVLDASLCVRSASRSFYRSFGMGAEETEGRRVFDVGGGAWNIPRLRRLLEDVRERNTGVREIEVENEFPGVGLRTLRLDARRFVPQGDPHELILLTIEDVTERRRLEKALQQRSAELEERDRRKDQFLAMLGHELRNPLAPIRNCLEVLKATDFARPTLDECRNVIERQVRQMTRLIDDLLDISRITRGRIELRPQPLDLRTVVKEAVEGVRPQVGARQQSLSVSLPDQPVPIKGDPLRLGQVLTNLLSNAARYSEDRGRISVVLGTETGEAVLKVRDQGLGIAADMLPRIFEPFVQADSSLARSRGGLGIGLALVRTLVSLHGGTVEGRSAGLGQGSEFEVRVPLAPAVLAAIESPAPAEPPPRGASRRVLVVEDNVDSAESLALMLQLAGHEVTVAHDGPAALQTAGPYRPDVVLLDIGLPGMDGYEVARRMRTLPGLERAFLVALSGYGQEEDRRRSREAGFDHHLTKPAEPDAVERLLGDLPPQREASPA